MKKIICLILLAISSVTFAESLVYKFEKKQSKIINRVAIYGKMQEPKNIATWVPTATPYAYLVEVDLAYNVSNGPSNRNEKIKIYTKVINGHEKNKNEVWEAVMKSLTPTPSPTQEIF
jgi:hypothetical protein